MFLKTFFIILADLYLLSCVYSGAPYLVKPKKKVKNRNVFIKIQNLRHRESMNSSLSDAGPPPVLRKL